MGRPKVSTTKGLAEVPLLISSAKDAGVNNSIRSGVFTGIVSDLSNHDYQRAPALGNSGLKVFSRHPAAYQKYMGKLATAEAREETASQRVGTLCHMATLEPHLFAKAVRVTDRRTNVNKALIAQAEAEGLPVMSEKEYDQACRMRDAILGNPDCAAVLKGGLNEHSIFQDVELEIPSGEVVKIKLKCRPDTVHTGDWLSADLKYYGTLDQDELGKNIYRSGYHRQAFIYRTVISRLAGKPLEDGYLYIFVTDDEDPDADVFELDQASLDKAESEVSPVLQRFAECQLRNAWPGRPSGIKPLAIPSFAW